MSNHEDTYVVLRDGWGELTISNFGIGDERVVFTGNQQECEDYISSQVSNVIDDIHEWEYPSDYDFEGF